MNKMRMRMILARIDQSVARIVVLHIKDVQSVIGKDRITCLIMFNRSVSMIVDLYMKDIKGGGGESLVCLPSIDQSVGKH